MESERNLNLEEKPQQVVRAIVVSLVSADEIYDFLKGQRQTPPSFLRFYLGVKGNEEEGYRHTFLGGKLILMKILMKLSNEKLPKREILFIWEFHGKQILVNGDILQKNQVREM